MSWHQPAGLRPTKMNRSSFFGRKPDLYCRPESISLNAVDTWLPASLIARMATMAMRTTSKAYSTIEAPLSSLVQCAVQTQSRDTMPPWSLVVSSWVDRTVTSASGQ